MNIGVLKEVKEDENRVAITPGGVRELVKAGHRVWVQQKAGEGSNFPDDAYQKAGAHVEKGPVQIAKKCRLIVKVKEPLKKEYRYFNHNHIIFTYFHFAGSKSLTKAMMKTRTTCMAYETVEKEGNLPLLQPMSEVAGRASVLIGSNLLAKPRGGRGLLVGVGSTRTNVLVIGAGHVGMAAAEMGIQMGGMVTVLDVQKEKVRAINERRIPGLKGRVSSPSQIERRVREADIVVGAVLVAGAKAPKVVTKKMVHQMRKGSVIMDVAIDQGGCVETSRVTSHSNPVFTIHGVLHYGVPNMPGAFPETATGRLTRATLPYIKKIAGRDLEGIYADPALRKGLNLLDGKIVYKPIAEAHKLPFTEI